MSAFWVAFLITLAGVALIKRRSVLFERAMARHASFVRQHRAEGLPREGWARREELLDEVQRVLHAPLWRWTP